MRKNEKYTDYIGVKVKFDEDGRNVIDGVFKCNHCGKENIRYGELREHFEECFKAEEEEWQSEYHPAFIIDDWELVFVRFQEGEMDVSVLPQYSIKEEFKNEVVEEKVKLRPVTTNVGFDNIQRAVKKYEESHDMELKELIVRKKDDGKYAVFYESIDE